MTTTRRALLLVLAFLVLSLPAVSRAQQPDPAKLAAQREHMEKLSFLAGEWQGSGWMMMGPGQRHEFTQSEWVESKLDGLLLAIEGLGKAGGEIVHRAYAVVDYDDTTGKYRFTAYSRGFRLESEAKVGENTMQWGMRDPRGGHIRYTISLTPAGEWHEIGEYSQDGEKWNQFFEMTLKKAAD